VKTPTIFSRLFGIPVVSGATPTPHLERRPEFEEALRNYRSSPETAAILAKTPIVTLTAPSATGRNTIIDELVKTGRYHFIVSDTTRPPRMNKGVWEQHGREYFFRSEDEMLQEIREGAFVEAELIHNQQVSGTSAREIERAHHDGKIAITDVDIEGGINFNRLKPDAITICMLPPSFDSWIARMRGRSDFKPDELYRRLQQATKVLRLALAHRNFVFVINDNFKQAIQTVDDIATKGLHHAEDEAKTHAVAEELYHETVQYLRHHAPEVQAA